jgi:hypothetical protein
MKTDPRHSIHAFLTAILWTLSAAGGALADSGCFDSDKSKGGVAAELGLSSSSLVSDPLEVWANSGEDKVTRNERRVRGNPSNVINSMWDGHTIRVFGAKNEMVNFNAVLEAPSGATDVSVSFDSLAGPNGNAISSRPAVDNGVFDFVGRPIEVFFVRYLQIKGLSRMSYDVYDERHVPIRMRRPWTGQGNGSGGWVDRPDHDKFYPEIAVPLELVPTFSIPSDSNQSIWVDIYIPSSTVAGMYNGQFVVRVNGNVSQTIPVQLRVYDFALPDIPSAKTMLYFSSPNINHRYLGSTWIDPNSAAGAKAKTIRDRHFLLAHRHRFSLIGDLDGGDCVSPGDRPCPEWEPRLNGSLFTAANGYDGPGVNIGNNVYSIATYGSWSWKPGGQAAMNQHTDAWATWFNQNSPATERFLYLIDESADTVQTETWAKWILNNPGPGGQLKSMATIPLPTAAAETPSLDIPTSAQGVGIPEQWQPLVNLYTQDSRKRYFMYNGNRPATGSTGTEDDGVALRERAWAQYKLKVNRWFFWETTYYNDFQGGTGEINVFQSAHTFGSIGALDSVKGETGWNYSNGDGVLFYPGTDMVFPSDSYGVDGPFASLRLKHWRRGLQDVDYLTLAAALDPVAVHTLVNAMVPKAGWEYGVSNTSDPTYILTDISWSTDPNDWEAARGRLADIIAGPSNQQPVVSMTTTVSGLTVTADGSQSHDPDGTITAYDWEFGDGSSAQGATVSHQYLNAGSYTITLAATDNAGAVSHSQIIVTISAPPANGSITRYEESDSLVVRGPTQYSWGGGADSRASANFHMATATAGGTMRLPFNGTGISVVGLQDSCSGQAQVQVDDNVQMFDAYRASGGGWQRGLYSITGLPAGSHTLTLTVLGTKQPASCGAWIYIDAFDVTGSSTRVEESDSRIVRGPTQYNWNSGADSRASASAYMASATAGVTMGLPFNGTGINIIGNQDSCSGQAQVQVDGNIQTFDAYRASGGDWQRGLYSITGLPAGSHMLTLTVLGTKQPTSCGAWIYVDAFDIIASSTRIEEYDSRIVRGPTQYNWNSGTDSRASASAYMASATAGVTMGLPFNGTGISVIGNQDSCTGQAQVQVDDNVQTFDAYRASGGGWQRGLYSITGLPAGSHMLTLTVLGTKQPASCGAWIYIDAFEVQY